MGNYFVCTTDDHAAEWRAAFGCTKLPLVSPTPEWVNSPEIGNRLVYLVDLSEFSHEQLQVAVAEVARWNGLPVAILAADWQERGVCLVWMNESVWVEAEHRAGVEMVYGGRVWR